MLMPFIFSVALCSSRQVAKQTATLGARHVIYQISQPQGAAKIHPFAGLDQSIDAFAVSSNRLGVPKAVDGWLALYDRWRKLIKMDPPVGGDSGNGPILMMRALPRPETWGVIQAQLRKRGDDVYAKRFVLLFDVLLGNDRAVVRQLEALRQPRKSEGSMDLADMSISKFELPFSLRVRDVDSLTKIFFTAGQEFAFFFIGGAPDLVSLIGEEKAEPILRNMLLTATENIDKINGEATRALARKIAIEEIDKIKKPQWSLAAGPDATKYVERLISRFGEIGFTAGGDPANLYFLDLFRTGRREDAKEFARTHSVSESIARSLTPQEVPALFQLLDEVLATNGSAPVWDLFVSLGNSQNLDGRLIQRLEATLQTPGLPIATRRELTIIEAGIAAAHGDAKQAIDLRIAASQLKLRPDEQFGKDRELLELGLATKDERAFRAYPHSPSPYNSREVDSELLRALIATNRFSEAEEYVLRMAKLPNQDNEAEPISESALRLAEIYYRANRPKDILTLLKDVPDWPASDLGRLVGIRADGYYRRSFQGASLGFLAAWAFANTGKKDLAIRTLHQLLGHDIEDDSAFELLNSLEGESALPLYDRLSNLDPLATRPVLWKADLLRRLGKLPEAESIARQAVAMDPTDGEAPPGRRLMSFTVLAKILRAEKKTEEAEMYERIVKAVRLGEKGDIFRDAGLLPQAEAIYREADEIFNKAYCLHFRLASTLEAEGKTNQALEHYRQAYALMPSSFGRAAEACLGCEGVFGDPQRTEEAVAIFTKLREEKPENAAIYYLEGLVRKETGDSARALDAFRQAVRIDPKYLNAWIEIIDLADKGLVAQAELNRACLAVVELDPFSLHRGYVGERKVTDYASLWRLYRSIELRLQPYKADSIMPLNHEKQIPAGDLADRREDTAPPIGWNYRKGPSAKMARLEVFREFFELPMSGN